MQYFLIAAYLNVAKTNVGICASIKPWNSPFAIVSSVLYSAHWCAAWCRISAILVGGGILSWTKYAFAHLRTYITRNFVRSTKVKYADKHRLWCFHIAVISRRNYLKIVLFWTSAIQHRSPVRMFWKQRLVTLLGFLLEMSKMSYNIVCWT